MKVKEIQIPTSWGHLAGKLWGSDKKRPLLAIHGWQDNAGSWDTLIPLLPDDCSVLAIDLPGHGHSSWYPKGMWYNTWSGPQIIQYIQNYYKWDKVSLLTHSLGSCAALTYVMLFPEKVDLFIAIESLVSGLPSHPMLLIILSEYLRKLQDAEQWSKTEAPSYEYEDLKNMMHEATSGSVSLESTPYILNRGTRPSKDDPKKISFTKDPRIKYIPQMPEDKESMIHFASLIKTPMLYIKCEDSVIGTDELTIEIKKSLNKNNESFESHTVPGTHHAHLNNPEIVAPIIIDFLKKNNFLHSHKRHIRSNL